jgi:hypothetical protein
MIVCQWHLDIPYGKQAEALAVIRAWGASDALAPFVVPGSQRWIVYRVLDTRPG